MELKYLATVLFVYLLTKDLALFSLSKVKSQHVLSNPAIRCMVKVFSLQKLNKIFFYSIVAILGYYVVFR